MKRLLVGLLCATALATSGCASMGTSPDTQVRRAPPPPNLAFRGAPRFRYLEDRQISVIAEDNFGYDLFRSGESYYLYNGGYWYHAHDVDGPFVSVDARRVPRQVFYVKDNEYRWRNHPNGWRSARRRGNDSHRPGGGPGGHGH